MAERRSYKQFCGLALALDVVGERWTLLIVRDLAMGPMRYSDLLDSNHGIGEGLLAQRLRHLEAEEVVRRRFDDEAKAVVYELTDEGRSLAVALLPLLEWGYRRMERYKGDPDQNAEWLIPALRSRFDPLASRGIREHYEFRVDGEVLTVVADDGRISVERGARPDPAVVLTTDLDTLMGVGTGVIDRREAVLSGHMKLEGERDAIRRYTSLLRLPNGAMSLVDARP